MPHKTIKVEGVLPTVVWNDCQSAATAKLLPSRHEIHFIGVLESQPLSFMDRYPLDTVLFLYTVEGVATITDGDGQTFSLDAGHCTVVFPGHSFSIRLTAPHNRLAYMSLKGAGIVDAVLSFGFCDRGVTNIEFPENFFRELLNLFTGLKNDGRHPNVLKLAERLLDTFALRLRNCGGNAPLFDAVKAINTMPREVFTLEEAAKRLNRSRTSLVNLFKAGGMPSPGEYIARLRTLLAKEMLFDREKSVAQIAAALGFAGTTPFTAFFRRRTGLTPTAFRRRPIT